MVHTGVKVSVHMFTVLLHCGIDTESNEMVLPALGKGPSILVKSIIFQWSV